MHIRLVCLLGALCLTGGCGDLQPDVAAISSEPATEAAMKISIERSGGFAGMTTRYEADVDTLSAEERAVVNELVSAAEFFALPSSIITPNDTSADRFSYRITIESADGTHTVETNDASVPDSLMPLIEWVSEQGRTARGN